MSVHIFCFIFGVHNGLILVKAIISRCCIADRYCDQIEGYSLKSKHFKSDQDRSDRTVGHTAENCCHSAGCTDRRRNSHKITHHTAKGSSNAERRYDLSPAESCAHSQCCKHHFPEKGESIRLSVFHRFFNKLRTSAHIFICSQNKGDNNDQAGAHCNPDIFILKPSAIKSCCTIQRNTEHNADNCTAQSDHSHFQSSFHSQCRNIRHMKTFRCDSHSGCKSGSDQ